MSRCGGKGWNLARLARYGFVVPAGGVLTVEAYDEILSRPEVSSLARDLSSVSAEDALSQSTIHELEHIRQAIGSARLSPETHRELQAFLEREALADVPLAVRSSAISEDSLRASFAGIHQSFLNSTGIEAVEHSILGCLASLWTPQALSYRRKMGFTDEEVRAAVVLCRMVQKAGATEPACAGVAFSCDPRTGRRDLVVIQAAAGTGDKVVSGAVTPDETVVRLSPGRFHVELRRAQGAPLLSPDQEIELARQIVRVHWALGDGQDPQDVEWAHDGERFWILQARPVTKLPRFTFEAARSLPVYWSSANLKDVAPGVISTLSWSILSQVIDTVLCAAPRAAGYQVPTGIELVRRFDGRCYFDFTAVQWCFYDALGILPADAVRSIGGHHPQIPVPAINPLKGPEGRRRRKAAFRLLRRLWRFDREIEQAISQHFRAVRSMALPDLHRLSNREIQQIRERILRLHDAIDERIGLANASMGAWQEMLEKQLRKVAGARAQSLMTRLLAGSGLLSSAEHGYRVYDLAEVARRDERARRWLESAAPASEWTTLPEDSPFRRELARFLDDFGHRGIYEADLMNPRWLEDPDYILDQVRALLPADKVLSPRAAAADVHRSARQELHRIAPWWRRILIEWLVRKTQKGMALRENAKSALVVSALPTRKIVLEIGRRMVDAGKLERVDDAFELATVDIDCYLHGEWDGSGAGALCRDRQSQRQQWLARTPPDVFVEEPGLAVRPVYYDTASSAAATQIWKGIPVAPGTATGRARVIRHPYDGQRLANGEILVAPSTDPGWTPLFLRAAAVVMETGGYLSHGAIVAREYGLPAIANVPGIVDHLADGTEIRVDADRGVVELLR